MEIQDPKIARELTSRQIMSYISLAASIIGASMLTFFAIGIVWIVWKGGWAPETAPQRISILSKALVISLGGSLVVLITLGLVIGRRTIRATKDGFELSNVEDRVAKKGKKLLNEDDDGGDDSDDGETDNEPEETTPTPDKA